MKRPVNGPKDLELRSCQGKFGYESWTLANDIANPKRKGSRNKRQGVDIYKCIFCRKFHLGGSVRFKQI